MKKTWGEDQNESPTNNSKKDKQKHGPNYLAREFSRLDQIEKSQAKENKDRIKRIRAGKSIPRDPDDLAQI